MNITQSTKVGLGSLLLLALLGSSSNLLADVYRWRDSKGVMQYSDVPPAAITNKRSEKILLNIIKDGNLCANPAETKVSKTDNNPIRLNILWNTVNTSLAKTTASISTTSTAAKSASSTTVTSSGTTTSASTSTFQPIAATTTTSTPTGVSVASLSKLSWNKTPTIKTGLPSLTTPTTTTPTTTTPTTTTPTTTTPTTTTPTTTTAGFTKIAPPKVAVFCNGDYEQCTIPAGVTAKVWYGVATKWMTKENVTGSVGCNKTVMGDPQSSAYNRCFYVDNKLLEKVLDPKGQNLMPAVNTALAPVGSKGFSTAMIKAAAIPPADKAGAFRISCEYSHMSNDDPIVFPGVPNATHHHTFFGNTGANAYSTSETLRNSGNGTCAGGIINRSGYWMPSLINTATGAPQKPSVIVVYYKAIDEYTGAYVKAPPPGLRMISGNAKPLAVADAEGGFYCQDQTQVMNPANWGIMWQGSSIKQSCGGANQMLRMIVNFPQCWDGKNLDSPDHKSHMAFACGSECEDATGKVTKSVNSCPASHPVAIPNITLNVDFRGLDANAKYRLASDNYSTAYPGGYSLHADWMNGWDDAIVNRMVKGCINNPKNCGGPNLGDGETLYGVNQD